MSLFHRRIFKFGDTAIEQLKSHGCCTKGGYDIAGWLRRNGWDIVLAMAWSAVAMSMVCSWRFVATAGKLAFVSGQLVVATVLLTHMEASRSLWVLAVSIGYFWNPGRL